MEIHSLRKRIVLRPDNLSGAHGSKLTDFIRQFFESEVKGIGIVSLKDFTYPGAIKKLIFYHSHHQQDIANHIAWATALINFNASLPAVLNQCE